MINHDDLQRYIKIIYQRETKSYQYSLMTWCISIKNILTTKRKNKMPNAYEERCENTAVDVIVSYAHML